MSLDNQIVVLVLFIIAALCFSASYIGNILENHSSVYEQEKSQKDKVWQGILSDEEIALMRQESELIEFKKHSDAAYKAGFKRGLNRSKGDNE